VYETQTKELKFEWIENLAISLATPCKAPNFPLHLHLSSNRPRASGEGCNGCGPRGRGDGVDGLHH